MDEAAELFNVSIKTFIKLLKGAGPCTKNWESGASVNRRLYNGFLGNSQYSSSDSDTRDFDRIAPEWEIMRSDYFDENVIGKLLD